MEYFVDAVTTLQDELGVGIEEQVRQNTSVAGHEGNAKGISVVVGDLKERVDGIAVTAEGTFHQFTGHPEQSSVLDVGPFAELADCQEIEGVPRECRIDHVAQREDDNST